MRTTIDKAGRLVIPRGLRGQVGLLDGGEVELVVDGAVIRVEPMAGRGLIEEGGFLVIPPGGLSIDDNTVRDMRHADQR